MSLRLLVDECLLNKRLIAALIEAGHDVQTAVDAKLLGQSDDVVFSHAINAERIIITSNCDDFDTIATNRRANGSHHPGLLLIYLYNDPKRDMSIQEIIAAIANLEETGLLLPDRAIPLNQYNY